MALSPRTKLGPYEIVASIGAGGMGEVYKARDTRLDRMVAVKVLPAEFAADPERRERFEREARAVSSLNHPHICTLYDVGRQDGIDYLVMELLDGESLAQRLTRGPLPIDEALRHAINLADALSKAHRKGVVHRDLKPGNVMLTKQGAKLLDFGLARVGVAAPAASASMLPTQEHPLTQEGALLGTFQYMAPEQLEGRDADARTDIFAFGALVYEMVTGRKAFEGKSQASLVASIMSGTPPPISSLLDSAALERLRPMPSADARGMEGGVPGARIVRAGVPVRGWGPASIQIMDRVVRVCLAKDPDERWQTAQDLASELKWIGEAGSQIGAPAPLVARRKSRERWAWVAAGLFAVLAIGTTAGLVTRSEAPPREPTRFSIPAPKDVAIEWPRLSPDGRTLAFVGTDAQGVRSIWVRPMGSFDAVRLEGTQGVQRPFWSPDSRYLAFFSGTQLKKIAASGGPPQLICETPFGSDGSWSQSGVILFDGRVRDPIKRVADSGGVPTLAVPPDAALKEVGTAWPYFLPDGRHFLFMSTNAAGPIALKLGSLDSPTTTVLADVKSRFEYSSGHVFYVSEQTLMARPFSADKLAFSGEPFPVTDRIQTLQNTGLVDFSTSVAGDLGYIANAQAQQSRLVWLDRSGKETGAAGTPGVYHDLALSPDLTRLAVAISAPGGRSDIWVLDIKRGAVSRLTFDDVDHFFPLRSPDGNRIAYTTARGGAEYKVATKLASGAGDEQVIGEDKNGNLLLMDWAPDGRQVLATLVYQDGNRDLVTLPTAGKEAPSVFLRTPEPIRETQGRFSPDGRWLAYRSSESGRPEVYVQSFPPSGGKWQISTTGGSVPSWRGDGKEIFYQAPDDSVYAVPIQAKGSSLDVGIPTKLFQRRLQHENTERNRWVVAPDGQRFLLNVPLDENTPRTIQVVLDWANGLNKK